MLIYILGVIILGVFVGLVSGMFGLGGGGIIVPALLPLLPLIGVPESNLMFMAMGPAFATMIISTSSATYNHFRNKNIDFKRVTIFLPAFLVTTFITSRIVTSINPNYLKLSFALFLLYLGIKTLSQTRNGKKKVTTKPTHAVKDIIYAATIGLISTLGSVSGSGLIVTYLNSTGTEVKKAIGTATFCGVFLTIFASIGFIISGLAVENLPAYSLGYIHLPTVILISILAIPMTNFGVRLMLKLPDKKLKTYFAYFLISLAGYMLVNTLLALI